MNIKKWIFTAAFLFTCCAVFSQTDTAAVNSVLKFQHELDAEYKDPKTSPLNPEALKAFKGHSYFPIDLNYKLEATLTVTASEEYFKMMTSNNKPRNYRQYGLLTFTLNGKEFSLPVYQSERLLGTVEYANYLFLPFTDLTNDKQSYSAGRYIDLRIPEKTSNTITIDFNKAYNPLCAYSDKYSCPIVPSKNHMDIEIKAGVQYVTKK